MYKLFAVILSLPFTVPALTVFADQGKISSPSAESSDKGSSVVFPNPIKGGDVTDVLNNIADWALIIGGPLATAMVIYGAFQIMTSGAVPAKLEAGKKTVKYALFGVVIVVTARLLVAIVGGIVKGL